MALCALILQKWRPKSKCRCFFVLEVMFLQFFFGQVREIWASLGKFGQKWCFKCFGLKKMRPKWNEMQSFLCGYFL